MSTREGAPLHDPLVLVVEPDAVMRRHLRGLLRGWGYEPVLAASTEEAASTVAHQRFLVTLLDPQPGGTDPLRLAEAFEARGGDLGAVIFLSETSDGIRTLAPRADDRVPKPFTPEELEGAIREALGRPRRNGQGVADEEARLRCETGLWRSRRMREIVDIIEQAADVDVTVLVCGETGTGKDLVARAIHQLSARRGQPFVKVNCAAVPRELLESELFGHERGAFTGAHQLKIGKFESANHGSVFLDEIGDLHPALQGKLLHVLQDGTFSRVGGRSTIRVDVRVLAATNQDLERAVEEGRFREDLYYRLNVIQVTVPPLRERLEEIPVLAGYFIERYSRLFKRPGFTPAPAAMERLLHHRYPGNVRELENIVKRMIVLSDPDLARIPLGPKTDGNGGDNGDDNGDGHPPAEPAADPVSLKDIARRAARAAERQAMARVLEQTNWNRVKAAKLLRISYRALLYKIKDTGLGRERAAPRLAV